MPVINWHKWLINLWRLIPLKLLHGPVWLITEQGWFTAFETTSHGCLWTLRVGGLLSVAEKGKGQALAEMISAAVAKKFLQNRYAVLKTGMPEILEHSAKRLAQKAAELEITLEPEKGLEQEIVLDRSRKSECCWRADRLAKSCRLRVKRVLSAWWASGRRDWISWWQELNRATLPIPLGSNRLIPIPTLFIDLKVLNRAKWPGNRSRNIGVFITDAKTEWFYVVAPLHRIRLRSCERFQRQIQPGLGPLLQSMVDFNSCIQSLNNLSFGRYWDCVFRNVGKELLAFKNNSKWLNGKSVSNLWASMKKYYYCSLALFGLVASHATTY